MKNNGQALISLLVFAVVGMIVVTGAVAVMIINMSTTTTFALGDETYQLAEAGVENGILRFLRNSNYTGETLPIGNGSATITVSGNPTVTITSEGVIGNDHRRLQVVGTYSNNIFTITSWTEIN